MYDVHTYTSIQYCDTLYFQFAFELNLRYLFLSCDGMLPLVYKCLLTEVAMCMSSQCLMMMVYCSAPSVKYYYDVAMVHTDGSQKQAVLLLTGMV